MDEKQDDRSGSSGGDEPQAASAPPSAEEARAAKIAAAKIRAAAGTAGGSSPAATPSGPVKKKVEAPQPIDASANLLVIKIKDSFPGAVVEAKEFLNQLSVRLRAETIADVCQFLRDDPATRFNYLTDLTCVHYPPREAEGGEPFDVIYNLYSIERNARVRLKIPARTGVKSVVAVWPSANWMEREVFDLFGVRFEGHPDLRRLLLPPDWEGHPLRKDYPLEFVENNWTAKHLPDLSDVARDQLEQRRNYGLEALSHPDERRVRELFQAGREPMPLDRKE